MSVEAPVKRERVVAAALAGFTLLAWAWLVRMGGMDMGAALPVFSLPLAFLMWAVMMVGRMLPSAGPMIPVFAAVNRRRAERGGAPAPQAQPPQAGAGCRGRGRTSDL